MCVMQQSLQWHRDASDHVLWDIRKVLRLRKSVDFCLDVWPMCMFSYSTCMQMMVLQIATLNMAKEMFGNVAWMQMTVLQIPP